jgi:hypothetical protein
MIIIISSSCASSSNNINNINFVSCRLPLDIVPHSVPLTLHLIWFIIILFLHLLHLSIVLILGERHPLVVFHSVLFKSLWVLLVQSFELLILSSLLVPWVNLSDNLLVVNIDQLCLHLFLLFLVLGISLYTFLNHLVLIIFLLALLLKLWQSVLLVQIIEVLYFHGLHPFQAV